MYKGLPSSYSLLQGKVQNGPHFSRTKFRIDGVLRGPVGLFGPLKQLKFNIEVMNLFAELVKPLRGVVCCDISLSEERSQQRILRSVQ